MMVLKNKQHKAACMRGYVAGRMRATKQLRAMNEALKQQNSPKRT
jgi:hypothetical protein